MKILNINIYKFITLAGNSCWEEHSRSYTSARTASLISSWC